MSYTGLDLFHEALKNRCRDFLPEANICIGALLLLSILMSSSFFYSYFTFSLSLNNIAFPTSLAFSDNYSIAAACTQATSAAHASFKTFKSALLTLKSTELQLLASLILCTVIDVLHQHLQPQVI